ncbi:MAG: substrate-binding domain-containing protein [Treponemataceae bacterium]
MKRVIAVMLIAALACAGLFAAGSADKGKGKDKKVTIAYVTPGLDVPFWRDLAEGIHMEAAKLNVKIIDSDSRNSAATQLKNVQDLITAGVDGIIISPTDSASCPPVLELAEKAKIPVVICDIGTDSGNYASFVITDNYGGAKMAGQYTVEALKKLGAMQGAEVAVIDVSLSRANGRNRLAGYKDAVEAAGGKVVAVLEAKDYTRAESMRFTQDLIVAHPNLKALFAAFDEAVMGALPAIETAGKQKSLVLTSFDGSMESVAALKEGKFSAISAQQGPLMGRKALDAMMDVLAKKEVAKKIDISCFMVTAENVNSVKAQLEENVFPPAKK